MNWDYEFHLSDIFSITVDHTLNLVLDIREKTFENTCDSHENIRDGHPMKAFHSDSENETILGSAIDSVLWLGNAAVDSLNRAANQPPKPSRLWPALK